MNAWATWVRLDLRRRTRSLSVLALLVALSAATVMTAVAGARRGATAVDRLLEVSEPATLAVLPNQPGFDWDAVAAIPGVAAIARFPLSQYEVDGLDAQTETDFAYADASIMSTIERPVVLDGRLADPARDDEAVVTPWLESKLGLGVGDTVTIRLFTAEQLDATGIGFSTEAPAGPVIESTIVGVVRSGWFGDGATSPNGRLIPSPGLFAKHPENLVGSGEVIAVNALIRLDGGAAAIPAFREKLVEVSGRRDIEFFNLAENAAHASDVAGFEADNLMAFALAAGVASLLLIGQSVIRYAAGSTVDLEVLRAVGMPPWQTRLGVASGPIVAAVAGAVMGAVASVAVSDRFPIGSAGTFEASPGRDVDPLVMAAGVVALPLLIGGGALFAAGRLRTSKAKPARSTVAAWLSRRGAPVPVVTGSEFAFERGGGTQAVPVRPALVGAIVGVLGVVAALTFAAGVDDASTNPVRFGQVHELDAFLGFTDEDFAPVPDVLAAIAADPDVAAVNDTRQAVAEAGAVDVSVFAIDPVGSPIDIVVSEGRAPATRDEVSLAPATAEATGAGVGDAIELAGSTGSHRYTVTGIAFAPTGIHNDYDSGAWMPADGYELIFDGFKFHSAFIDLRDGADPEVVAARLGATVAEALGDPALAEQAVTLVEPPDRLSELRQVRRLPVLLAGFLTILAIGAVGHALATAVRRRRHDIAVLRTLGFTRWQCRAMVVTQATLLALVGVVVGAPLGLVTGRTIWRAVADSTPVAYSAPTALWVLLLIAPAAFAVANLLAAWPSRRAARLRIGHVLRAE